jgi:hypothetical protein
MEQKRTPLRAHAKAYWKPLASFAAVFAFISGELLWRLNSLLPGYSATEIQAFQQSQQLSAIWEAPLNAPYHILTHLFSLITSGPIATRLASVTIAWFTIVVFCALLYRWYGTRTALIGTLLFGSSSWFLHTGRLGSPQVCFLAVVTLVALGVWIREEKGGAAVILGLAVATGLMYTPGMVWLIATGLLWQWKHIDTAFKKHLGSVTIGAAIFLVGLAPLAYKFYKMPELIRPWLGLPDSWQTPLQYLQNFAEVPLSLFVRGQENPELWLGRLPVLSIFSIVAFIIGMYIFYKYLKLARVKLLVALALLGSVLIALSDGIIPLTVLVPFVYTVVALGATYMIDLWLRVFPRNPIARAIGIGCFSVLLVSVCLYNMRSYYIAWPQATITRQFFIYK